MSRFLLDTCALIWAGTGEEMSDAAVEAFDRAQDARERLSVSAISSWELGLLVSRNRLRLPQSVQEWFGLFMKRSGCQLAQLSSDILIASSFLPGTPPKDPADRMVIATARDLGLTIVTRDRLILDYAEQGHVMALKC